jgi:predicted kinase
MSETTGVEVLQARLWQAAQDLAAGRITATEANRITKEARRELLRVSAAMRAVKVARRLGSG